VNSRLEFGAEPQGPCVKFEMNGVRKWEEAIAKEGR